MHACVCVCLCGRGKHEGFSKGMEPSFSGIHGNRTLRSTGSEARGGGGGKEGETEGTMGEQGGLSRDKMM